VVDDDLDLAAVICNILNGMGHFRAKYVGDGAAALAACQSQSYDLLILDYQLPQSRFQSADCWTP
jgi:CheY-like chemotaxis protein